jgi:hypothetical protein
MKLHPMIVQGAFLAGYMHKEANFDNINAALQGGALGVGAGAGLGAAGQAVTNTLEGKEHKLKDYLKTMLIGGGIGGAGGAALASSVQSDISQDNRDIIQDVTDMRLNSLQDQVSDLNIDTVFGRTKNEIDIGALKTMLENIRK